MNNLPSNTIEKFREMNGANHVGLVVSYECEPQRHKKKVESMHLILVCGWQAARSVVKE